MTDLMNNDELIMLGLNNAIPNILFNKDITGINSLMALKALMASDSAKIKQVRRLYMAYLIKYIINMPMDDLYGQLDINDWQIDNGDQVATWKLSDYVRSLMKSKSSSPFSL